MTIAFLILYFVAGLVFTPTVVKYISLNAFNYMAGITDYNTIHAHKYVTIIFVSLVLWAPFMLVLYYNTISKENSKSL